MIRAVTYALALTLWAAPTWADALTERLLDALQADRLLNQMALEAERTAEDIDRDFLDGRGGAVLADAVTRLNDPARLRSVLSEQLTDALDEITREALVLFYESDLGQEVVNLELSARSTIFDPAVDQAVRARVAETGVPPLITRMIENGDLTANNVRDSKSALTQFYMGRLDAGMSDMTPGEIQTFVDEAEEGMLIETQAWLEAFMTLAYSPLSEDELETYVTFWETETGKAYDEALFGAFRMIFDETNYGLGQVVGRLEISDEI